jgi:hypothetical protein
MITADCAAFEDGDLCNGTLFCRSGTCRVDPATIVECDPSADTDCRRNTCDPATAGCRMTNEADGIPCDDGLYCTVDETCRAGVCTSGGSPCPAEPCAGPCDEAGERCPPAAPGTVCRPAGGPCDVQETCNGTSMACPADAFASSEVVCRPAAGECDRAETCTGASPSCRVDTFRPDDTPCDDDNTCTTRDRCWSGECTGTAVTDGTSCDDGTTCTEGDHCTGGACRGTTVSEVCDDHIDNDCDTETDEGCGDPGGGHYGE